MRRSLLIILCGSVLLIAAAVAVVVVSRNRQQPAPPPNVPVAALPDEVRVKAVERKPEPVDNGEMVWRERPWQIWFINPIGALSMPSGEWQFQYDLEDYRTEIMKRSKAEWTSEEQIEENILKENRDASVEELLKSITNCFLKSGGKL